MDYKAPVPDWGTLDATTAPRTEILGSWMTVEFGDLHRLLKLPTDVQILAIRPGPDAHTVIIDMTGKLPAGAVQAIYQANMVRDTRFSCWVAAKLP